MLSGKKILSAVLSAALLLSAASALAEDDAFAAEIERRYTAPSIDNRSEVRWWMAEAGHTDETIRAEIQAMYDGGFRGVELCAQGEDEISEGDYGYGTAQDTGAFRKYKRADGTPVNQLDLWMNTEKEGRRWGRKRNVTVLVKLG